MGIVEKLMITVMALLLKHDQLIRLDEAAKNGITVEHWIPTTILRVVNLLEEKPRTLSALRALHFGSMPISSRLLARLRAVLDVELVQLYGSTDCGLIARSEDLRDVRNEGYMRLIPDSGCRIVDAKGDGKSYRDDRRPLNIKMKPISVLLPNSLFP